MLPELGFVTVLLRYYLILLAWLFLLTTLLWFDIIEPSSPLNYRAAISSFDLTKFSMMFLSLIKSILWLLDCNPENV
jgi:hypothetical protein